MMKKKLFAIITVVLIAISLIAPMTAFAESKKQIPGTDYEVLNYVESSGDLEVDTLYQATPSLFKAEVECAFFDDTKNKAGTQQNIFGAGGNQIFLQIALHNGMFGDKGQENGWKFQAAGKATEIIFNDLGVDTLKHKFVLDGNATNVKVDNSSKTLNDVGGKPTDNIYLFGYNNDPTVKSKIRLFSAKFYEYNNAESKYELVRDFIPARTLKKIDKTKNATDSSKDIPAGTVCLYDAVGDKYYLPNTGTLQSSDTSATTVWPETTKFDYDGKAKTFEPEKAYILFDYISDIADTVRAYDVKSNKTGNFNKTTNTFTEANNFIMGKVEISTKYFLEDGTTLTNEENSGAKEEGGAPIYGGKYVSKYTVKHYDKVYNDEKAFTIVWEPPKTGDQSNAIMWLMVAIGMLIAIATTIGIKKSKNC